ncbi:hypothetical protein [Streptomyces xanthophaeus]|uniref:hypothetical protein n=1 Tax=Streptomyces xanthophaeus TaxID=67385 RepID=UPI002648572B|nr:hypothetical protein [Streptomyces xanthophaeus]WKD36488.1 hypothetical protein KO717_34195 [Streptomyces xanthophaeus]
MTTDDVTWQRDAPPQPPAPCSCGAMPLPLGGPEGGAVVHAPACSRGGRYGIS